MACKVAIIGACSLVGRELLKTLSDRSFPLTELRLFEVEHSVGQHLSFNKEDILVEEISEHVLKDNHFRFVFFASGYKNTQMFAKIAQEAGSIVIDLSHYSYQHLSSTLSVPDINFKKSENNTYSSPTSLAIQLSSVLAPIQAISAITSVNVSTYQSVSGAGYFGVEELERQITEINDGKEASVHYFDKQIAFNVLPQIDHINADGWTKEELLVSEEVQTILNDKNLSVSLTCVRVPVLRGHSVSVMVELEKELSFEEIYTAWEEHGFSVYKNDEYPTPWELEDSKDIGVGRLRVDQKNANRYYFWAVSDNITSGMSLNPVLIAEQLL